MSRITHFLSPTPPGGIMILPLQGTMLLLGWGRAQCLPSESQQYLMCDGAYGYNNGGPSQRTCLYSPRCREGAFPETQLPSMRTYRGTDEEATHRRARPACRSAERPLSWILNSSSRGVEDLRVEGYSRPLLPRRSAPGLGPWRFGDRCRSSSHRSSWRH